MNEQDGKGVSGWVSSAGQDLSVQKSSPMKRKILLALFLALTLFAWAQTAQEIEIARSSNWVDHGDCAQSGGPSVGYRKSN